jgi:hypothetical protein
MPAHKGVEPFSRFWTLQWRVVSTFDGSTAAKSPARNNRPRMAIFGSEAEANAAHDELLNNLGFTAGKVAHGTVDQVQLAIFRNRKFNVEQFIGGFIATIFVAD